MGRPLDGDKYELLDVIDGMPVYYMQGDEFTRDDEMPVPFEELRLVEKTSFPIPGLRTKHVVAKEKYLEQINIFPVNINFLNHLENGVSTMCYVACGRTRAGEIAASIHHRLLLNPFADITLSIEGSVVYPETQMHTLYANNMSSDGFLNLDCLFENAAEVVFEAPGYGGPPDDGPSDDDVYDDGTEGTARRPTPTRKVTCAVPTSTRGYTMKSVRLSPKWLLRPHPRPRRPHPLRPLRPLPLGY